MKSLVWVLTLIHFPALMFSQTVIPNSTATENVETFQPGAVVEEVSKSSAAEKAGLREGDVLLVWSRGDATGMIESPFDISIVATEQAPRGIVFLKGLRGSEKLAWTLGSGQWGLTAQPAFQNSILQPYLQGRKLAQDAKAGLLDDASKNSLIFEGNASLQ